MSFFPLIFLGLVLGFSSVNTSLSIGNELKQENTQPHDPPCPLNFDHIDKMVKSGSYYLTFIDIATECRYILQGFRLFRSVYVRQTGIFSFPSSTCNACWRSYQNLVEERLGPFDVRSNCGVETSWISNDCRNITSRSEFESLIPSSQLQRIERFCNQSLGNTSSDSCDSCRAALLGVQEVYFRVSEAGNSTNATDCPGYPYIYAAAFVNQLGPTDFGTAKCLFSLDLTLVIPGTKEHKRVPRGMFIGCTIGFLGAVAVVWFLWRWLRNRRRNKKTENFSKVAKISALEGERITLVKFTFEEMKAATRNFSRGNLIGKGGYGNVYRGILSNGSQVAVKRFKNCSVSGHSSFTHEVEVIASVRHVNLVALRGYCTATDGLGHRQRLIACDLMRNGSLYDHLYGLKKSTSKLSWPVRRKIALGTARGLAYLHYGAQPAIIHRDVKSSNILLDENFEPKLADFGLARFTPEGFLSHLSTRVAGTFGYVAPEYALYGQLTERSDVFSFGVVLLELLSGKQAVLSVENGQSSLLTDWAWSLVRNGKAMEVIEEGMSELAPPEVMEKYVLVGVVSAHPVRYARPSMEQIVNILENHDLAAEPVIQDPAISTTQSTSNGTSGFSSIDQDQSSKSGDSHSDPKEI